MTPQRFGFRVKVLGRLIGRLALVGGEGVPLRFDREGEGDLLGGG